MVQRGFCYIRQVQAESPPVRRGINPAFMFAPFDVNVRENFFHALATVGVRRNTYPPAFMALEQSIRRLDHVGEGQFETMMLLHDLCFPPLSILLRFSRSFQRS